MKELLIFDFDGLLVDTERVYFDGWLALFKKYQLPITAADIFGWRGQSWQQTASKLADLVGGQQRVQELRAEREVYIAQQITDGTFKTKPYAKETIALAREKGFQTALATSTMKKEPLNCWRISICCRPLTIRPLAMMSPPINLIQHLTC